jgi:catechol 2,3-dioxygenase-like lactoylglutathione lyase family enzyme
MDWTLEVVILPVSDIDRAVAFYRDQVGFELGSTTTPRTRPCTSCS